MTVSHLVDLLKEGDFKGLIKFEPGLSLQGKLFESKVVKITVEVREKEK